jgi:tetratricopeptide (TPR) repeat protein
MVRTIAIPVLSQVFRTVDNYGDRNSVKNNYDVYIEFAQPKMVFTRDCDTWWHLLMWFIPPVGTLVEGPAASFAGWPTIETLLEITGSATDANGVVLLNRIASSGGRLLNYDGGAQSIALGQLSPRLNNMFAGMFASLVSELGRSPQLQSYAKARHDAETARREMERNAKMAAVTGPEHTGIEAERSGRLREAFTQYAVALEALQTLDRSPDLQTVSAEAFIRLRERILKVSQRLTPPPAIPEAAERRVLRGKVAFKQATKPADNEPAIGEFQEAVRLAPWWSDAYFNLALAQEKAGRLADAIASYKWYLTASPDAKDFQEVKDKVVELEYLVERQQKAH